MTDQKITKTKQSYGLACCKYIEGKLHILMVKKKYTYAFFEFVFCKYPKFDKIKLEKLFNSMTYQEKTDILEMDFDKLWRKIVINVPDDPRSLSKKSKLKRVIGKPIGVDILDNDVNNLTTKEKEYQIYSSKKQRFLELIDDGGRKLKELIHQSKSADPIWEIPKGRPEPNEKPADTAMREFNEETFGTIDNYRILYDLNPVKINYVIMDCLYTNEYFIALADEEWIPHFEYNCYENNREVEELRWITFDEIKYLNRGQHTYKRMINLFSSVSKLVKKHKPANQRIII